MNLGNNISVSKKSNTKQNVFAILLEALKKKFNKTTRKNVKDTHVYIDAAKFNSNIKQLGRRLNKGKAETAISREANPMLIRLSYKEHIGGCLGIKRRRRTR